MSITRRASAALPGLDGDGEARVRLGIFVGAIDLRRVGQRHQLGKARGHLRRRPLEQPPAAQCEQRVAAEQDPRVGEVIGVVAAGVAGDVDHPPRHLPDVDRIALRDGAVDAGNLRRLARRAGDARAGRRLYREVAAGVVGVPVGVEDLRDPPAARRRRREDGIGDRGVDHRRLAVGVDEIDVVVGQHRDLDDLHVTTPRCSAATPTARPAAVLGRPGAARPKYRRASGRTPSARRAAGG